MTEASPKVIGLGEILWDCFGDQRKPGGAPANVAYHATEWGLDGCVCSRVGRDDLGRDLATYLDEKSVNRSGLQFDDSLPTSTVTVDNSKPGSPSYTIREDVAWDNMTFDDNWKQLALTADAVCFGSLAQRSDASRRAIWDFLEYVSLQCLVVFDVNLRQRYYYKKWLDQSMQYAWILKVSEEEAYDFAEEMGLCTHEPCKMYADQIRLIFGVPVTCFTRGANGCLLFTESESIDLPGHRIDRSRWDVNADSVGAGDAFTAALIYGFLRELPPETCAKLANRAGALVASKEGAMPDVKQEYLAILEELKI